MTTARELHDWMRNIADTEPDADVLAVTRGFYETILRALDLLARVEESEDELVRDLLEEAEDLETAFGRSGRTEMLRKAAADIVALRAENFDQLDRLHRLGHERDALKGEIARVMQAAINGGYCRRNHAKCECENIAESIRTD